MTNANELFTQLIDQNSPHEVSKLLKDLRGMLIENLMSAVKENEVQIDYLKSVLQNI